MSIAVTLRLRCDGRPAKSKCEAREDFTDIGIVQAKNKAMDAQWVFSINYKNDDICLCPECGPRERPHLYGRK